MTSIVTNFAGRRAKKVIGNHAKIYEPEDPFYVTYTDDGGRERRIKVSGRAPDAKDILEATG